MESTINQKKCIQNTFGIPSAVVAGAGSGKTDTLTRRVAYALLHSDESGVNDINQILAITFTKKAAAELKSRIKQVLLEEATPENGLRDQALKADGAWISTIHGMCSRILRENALAFGIDPAFKTAQDEVLQALIDSSITEVLTRVMYEPASQEEVELLREYDRVEIRKILKQIMESASESSRADALDGFVIPKASDPVESLLQMLLCTQEILQRIEARMADPKIKKISTTEKSYYEKALRATVALLGLPATQESFELASTAILSEQRFGELRQIDAEALLLWADRFPKLGGNLAIAKEPLNSTGLLPATSLLHAASTLRLALGARFMTTMLRLAQQANDLFVQKKNAQGYLDNSDLLTLVGQKLRDPAYGAIAQRYAEQFRLIMVDEFQDTNQMQVDMINLVAGGAAKSLSDKICVVGDAQQSIYRFRNADLAVFQDYVRQVRESETGCVIELGDNFRSHADILAFCKEVFTDVFGQDYLDLLHGRDEEWVSQHSPFKGAQSGDDAQIPRRVNIKEFKAKSAGQISEMAAQEIARDFKMLSDCGNAPGQMAILLGKMTHAQVYARALQNVGLKCAITGGSVFRESADVQLIVDLCKALLNPFDTDALVRVLTSDLFCLCGDDLIVLVSLRESGQGSLADAFTQQRTALDNNPLLHTASETLHHAIDVLRVALKCVGTEPLSKIVADVLVESGWLYSQAKEGLSRAANVFKAIRVIKSIEQESSGRGFSLVERLQARLEIAKEAPGVLSAEGDDFVRIMTIHASKGLSIPIVAVAEADYHKPRAGTFMHFSKGETTYLSLDVKRSLEKLEPSGLVRKSLSEYASKSESVRSESKAVTIIEAVQCGSHVSCDLADYRLALNYLDQQGDLEEHQRKLYVAFTRAKDALIVTQQKPPESAVMRDNGQPTAAHVIAHLVDEPVIDEEIDKAVEAQRSSVLAVSQIVPLVARYPEVPHYDHEYELRYQYLSQQDKKDAESESVEPLESAEPVGLSDRLFPCADTVSFIEVPIARPQVEESRLVPYRAQWAEGIVSASSLKDATGEHAGDIDSDPLDLDMQEAAVAVHALEGEGERNGEQPALATERGVAFHALCEWAVRHRKADGSLVVPPQERIDAMARLYGLSQRQKEGLRTALACWFSSDAASRATEHAFMKAEQPFWVRLRKAEAGTNPIILQGFIDLLCYDQPQSGHAYVVDYKTGTGYNTDKKRRQAYELQAMCYAYALLAQGFEDVQLDFVFVDQSCTEGTDKPIVVHFPEPGTDSWSLEYLQAHILDTL